MCVRVPWTQSSGCSASTTAISTACVQGCNNIVCPVDCTLEDWCGFVHICPKIVQLLSDIYAGGRGALVLSHANLGHDHEQE